MTETEEAGRHPSKETLAGRIKGSLRKSAAGAIEAGKDLKEARDHACKDLTRDQWGKWLRDECGISRSDAVKLIKIAKCDFITGSDLNQLPVSILALYAIARTDAEVLAKAQENGEIHPAMTAKDVKALSKQDPPEGGGDFTKVTVTVEKGSALHVLYLLANGHLNAATRLTDDNVKAIGNKLCGALSSVQREALRDIITDSLLADGS